MALATRLQTLCETVALCIALLVSANAFDAPGADTAPASSASSSPSPSAPLLPVIWMAPFFSGGGYCSEAIDFAKSLSARTDMLIAQHGDSFDHAFVRGLPKDAQTLLARLARNGARVAPERAVVVCHSEPGAWHPPNYHTSRCPPANSLYTVGRSMFETDRLPSGWSDRLNRMDEIWVPTAFHLDIFVAGSVAASRVFVVGESVDVDFFDPARARTSPDFPFALPGGSTRRRHHRRPNKHTAGKQEDAQSSEASDTPADSEGDDAFAFLSIFKWEERKGWRFLLEAFAREFDAARDNVALYILTNNYHASERIEDVIRDFIQTLNLPADRAPPRIHLLPRGIATDALPLLYASVSAFVLPSRGEGWGRPHCEAMAMALPVIATQWSGPQEYMTEENSYPLRITGLEPIAEGAFAGHLWAVPDKVELQRLMRQVVTHPDEARERGLRARAAMVSKYCPACIAEHVVERLRVIRQKLKRNDREHVHHGQERKSTAADHDEL